MVERQRGVKRLAVALFDFVLDRRSRVPDTDTDTDADKDPKDEAQRSAPPEFHLLDRPPQDARRPNGLQG